MYLIPKKIIGLDFDDFSAQLVELKVAKNQINLEAYKRILLPAGIIKNGEINKEKELQTIIKQLFAEANPHPAETKEIAFTFPSTKVFTHIFHFPAHLKESEIKNALLYEAETVIPFSMQDVYWDYSITNKTEEKTDILFAAIPKETTNQYTKLFESIGLIPSIFTIPVDCLKQAVLKQINPRINSLIIDMHTLSTNYLIVQNDQIKYFFSRNKGGAKLIEQLSKDFQIPAEQIIKDREENKLSAKFLPKITAYLEENYKVGKKIIEDKEGTKDKVDTIVLSGHFLNFHNFYHLAHKHFRTKNIIVVDPRKYLKIMPENFKNTKDNTQAYATYFTNSVGAALRGLLLKEKESINLLPDYLKQTATQKRNSLIVALVSVAVCLASLILATFSLFHHQQMVYQRLGLEIEKSAIDKLIYGTRYNEIRAAIISFNKEVNEVSDIDTSLFSTYKVTEEILEKIPSSVELINLNFNDETLEITMTGIAQNREKLLAFSNELRNIKFVEEVVTPISNFDAKKDISFILKLKLTFKELPKYGSANDL